MDAARAEFLRARRRRQTSDDLRRHGCIRNLLGLTRASKGRLISYEIVRATTRDLVSWAMQIDRACGGRRRDKHARPIQ
jgi:hypothetical protein